MKVVVLGVRGIPNVQGGVETHAEQLYSRLATRGCDVEVLVRTPFVPRSVQRFGSVRIRRLWSPQTVGLEALVHSVIGVVYAAFARPDILHVHAVGPAIVVPIARLLGLRVVVTHHGPDYDRDKWSAFARWVLRCGERVGMRYSHARIAISRHIANLIRSSYDVDADLIPNGVNSARVQPESEHVVQRGLEPSKYFLQVSRIVPEKRQLDLIKAFSSVAPAGWKLALVGGLDSSEYSQQVQSAATAAGVVLTGFLNGVALAQMYSHAGAFVLPSSHEGLPIAMLEALSYGLPVLASDIPANVEVGLEASSYFPVGDVETLAESLRRVAATSQSEEARAARRQWVARAFDWDLIAGQTLAVYRKVAPGSCTDRTR